MIVLKCCRCDGMDLKKDDELYEDQVVCSNCGVVDVFMECELEEIHFIK